MYYNGSMSDQENVYIEIQNVFHSGRYSEVGKLLRGKSIASEFVPYIVASFVLSGNLEEAKKFYRAFRERLNASERVCSRYFLVRGLIGNGSLAQASTLLAKNFSCRADLDDDNAKAYVYLGLAIYYFHSGNPSRALANVKRAVSFSQSDTDDYVRMQIFEWHGKILLQQKSDFEPVAEDFKNAISLAKALKNEAVLWSCRSYLGLANARLTPHHERSLLMLNQLRAEIPLKFTKLHSEVDFARIEKCIFLGYFADAKGLLEMLNAKSLLPSHVLDEQKIALLYGDLCYATGDYSQALVHYRGLKAAQRFAQADEQLPLLVKKINAAEAGLKSEDVAGLSAKDRLDNVNASEITRSGAQKEGNHGQFDLGEAKAQELNHRQMAILNFLKDIDFVDVSFCKAKFNTSDITASRDLRGLTELGYVRRIGKARATKYRLAQSVTSSSSDI